MEINQALLDVEKQLSLIEVQIPELALGALKLSQDVHAANVKNGDAEPSDFQITQVLS